MDKYYSLILPVLNIPSVTMSPYLVDYNSRKAFKNAVETLAYYFRREMQYDFVQFKSSELPGLEGSTLYEAYLFLEPAYDLIKNDNDVLRMRVIGCCCFRKIFIEENDWYWCLDWIWFHPYFRHRGKLTDAWPMFSEKYQPFYITPPYSLEMDSFLKKVNWEDNF